MQMPIYVTRKTADGYTGKFAINAYLALIIFMLILLNALVWSGIALYLAVKFIANA